jgi:3-oxoacyl-[acyl-carrier protein] reductase
MGERLKGEIAIVTGASRQMGIGAAVCRALAKEGADIFFTYYTPYDSSMPWGIQQEELFTLERELKAFGISCEHLELDLSRASSISALFEQVEAKIGQASILVNNACYSVNDSFENLTADNLDIHYEINIRATTLLSITFANRFSRGHGGRIINLTSGQSKGPMTQEISYAITKGAVEILTTTLAAAVAHKGITVNAVNPGPTDTGWMTEELKSLLMPRFPFKRTGTPDDVARLICFLASEEGEWITGQIIHSEGGYERQKI